MIATMQPRLYSNGRGIVAYWFERCLAVPKGRVSLAIPTLFIYKFATWGLEAKEYLDNMPFKNLSEKRNVSKYQKLFTAIFKLILECSLCVKNDEERNIYQRKVEIGYILLIEEARKIKQPNEVFFETEIIVKTCFSIDESLIFTTELMQLFLNKEEINRSVVQDVVVSSRINVNSKSGREFIERAIGGVD